MAVPTPCQTPGTEFSTHVSSNCVAVLASLPFDLGLDEDGAKLLEDNIHNALELVLAPHFKNRQT